MGKIQHVKTAPLRIKDQGPWHQVEQNMTNYTKHSGQRLALHLC